MASDDSGSGKDGRSILDSTAFGHRLDEEIARVRRSGGFLSLAVFRVVPQAIAASPSVALARIGERLRRAVRLEDVLAERAGRLALLMPDTSGSEAARAAERLLAVMNQPDMGNAPPPALASAGVATMYGEVEGGGAALLAAADEALGEAAPGQFAGSRTLPGRPRILVVDDDITFANTLAETISERSWEAHPCTDVADARQRAMDTSYSGFFVDVVLPGSSGVDILKEAMTTERRRPAVLMSGKDVDPAMILEALSLGPVMFVRKPMSLGDLDSALEMFRQLVPGIRRRGRGRL
jgi:PleD family two-component response regulator